MSERYCKTCEGMRPFRWSRCEDCGTGGNIGIRRRDLALLALAAIFVAWLVLLRS